jgi:hypothetical protein
MSAYAISGRMMLIANAKDHEVTTRHFNASIQ